MISSAASATSPSNTFPRYFGEKQDFYPDKVSKRSNAK